MQGLGYKEILAYLDGTYSLEEAIYILKRDTRHFAKRQITWFKRERDVEWFHKPDFDYDEDRILSAMLQSLGEKGIYPAFPETEEVINTDRKEDVSHGYSDD